MTRLSLTVRLFPLIMFFFSVFCVFRTKIFCICFCVGDKVETFAVLKISPKDIVDTNGAGDAFVGGENLIEFHFSILKLVVCKYVFWILTCAHVMQVSCLSWSRRNRWISV